MNRKTRSESKINRRTIPEHTRLKLWVKAAGRCEFQGCNEPVWRNNLTLSDGNFGEVAHIIAASEDGPRGSEESVDLRIDYSNLMLLCPRCHIEIDRDPNKYSSELLRRWKQEHEKRIEIQTNYPEEIHKSTVVLFTVKIKDRMPRINHEAYRNAMFPKYPVDEGIKIEIPDFDRHSNKAEWSTYARIIERKIKTRVEEGIDDRKIKHFSVFAIGPMPLLMFLGKCIGDTIPADLYQSHRNIKDTSQTWSWQAEEPETQTAYIVNTIKVVENSEKVAIILALSDTIGEDKYANFVDNIFSVYEITIVNPSPHFLRNAKQLEHFSYEYRKLLNQVQAAHGHRCKVFILPAVPVSIAVECGRVLIPTKDPEIFACEYYDTDGFRKVLKIN
ncbi:MAG: HNH endonuclease [Candidatus Poribacteria bacterium]|nr:HNH endonuclease [Candidatus Poribacteria bacterium]